MTKSSDIISMTTMIVSSFVGSNTVDEKDLPNIINTVHSSLFSLNSKYTTNTQAREPAVPISKSITPDHIICLEDGKKLKMLKRYLRSRYNMTPDEYRTRWNLPHDYPMVAPNYTKLRSEYAKEIGLGRKKNDDT